MTSIIQGREVLILILMEHAQRECLKSRTCSIYLSLNPYFNGTCSKSMKQVSTMDVINAS